MRPLSRSLESANAEKGFAVIPALFVLSFFFLLFSCSESEEEPLSADADVREWTDDVIGDGDNEQDIPNEMAENEEADESQEMSDSEEGGCLDPPDGDEDEIEILEEAEATDVADMENDFVEIADEEQGEEADESDLDEDTNDAGEQSDSDDLPTEADETPQAVCPEDMALVEGRFCMDIYEASRPDATMHFMGVDKSLATSRPGVMPWYDARLQKEEARRACQNAGKRLCAPDEWFDACRTSRDTAYSYGDAYQAAICNGIDAFCRCGEGGSCPDAAECPFPHCRQSCGADFHSTPTGAMENCVNEYGIYDIHGNVWELVDTDDGVNHFRGGAYNCGDSESLHRCDYDADWYPSAQGFRCCKDKAQ